MGVLETQSEILFAESSNRNPTKSHKIYVKAISIDKSLNEIKINNNKWLYSNVNSNPSLFSGGDEQQLREGSPRQGVQAKQRLITAYLPRSSQAPARNSHQQPATQHKPGVSVKKSYKSTLISDFFSAAGAVGCKVKKVSEEITPPHKARMLIREAKIKLTQ